MYAFCFYIDSRGQCAKCGACTAFGFYNMAAPFYDILMLNIKFTRTKQTLNPIIQKRDGMSMGFLKIKAFFVKKINKAWDL